MTGTAPSLPGTAGEDWFGPYLVLRRLDGGGASDLYLARSPRLGAREVVLKRPAARFRDQPEVNALLLGEGRLAARVSHPNVVRVLAVGEVEGEVCLAMERLVGLDLREVAHRARAAGRAIPLPVACGLAERLAGALAAVHAARAADGRPLRIVHGDVSPGNVVISRRGVAKLVDFGLASAEGVPRPEASGAGTPGYMAPEQVRGEPLDARADLFGLGAILWELVAGERLFAGTPPQIMRAVCDEPARSPSLLVPRCPPWLERLVLRLLERDRRLRPPSALAVRRELRRRLGEAAAPWGRVAIARFVASLASP